jgi:hypothetical protein
MLGSSRGGGAEGSLVAQTLEGSMEELFGPYLEGARYLERESKSLGELYGVFLGRFSKYHVRSQRSITHESISLTGGYDSFVFQETVHKAKPNTLFDRVVSQLATASTSTTSSHTTQAAAAAILKYSGVEKKPGGATTGTATPNPELAHAEEPVRAEDGALSLEVGEKMLRWHAEAVGRCVDLSASGDVPKNAFALMRVLAEALGRSYIETALDSYVHNHPPKPGSTSVTLTRPVPLSFLQCPLHTRRPGPKGRALPCVVAARQAGRPALCAVAKVHLDRPPAARESERDRPSRNGRFRACQRRSR